MRIHLGGLHVTGDEIPLFGSGSPVNGNIKVYQQYLHYNTITTQWEGYNVPTITNPPSKGNSESSTLYTDYPIDASNSDYVPSPYTIPYHEDPELFEDVKLNIKHDISLGSGNILSVDNGIFVLEENFDITMSTNSGIDFSGNTSKLITENGSSITFPSNYELSFTNGATIDADGTTFTTSSGTWEGITLEDPKGTLIEDCTFSNVKNPIAIYNANLFSASEKHIITGNTFNMHASGNKAIEIKNTFECLIRDNTFNIDHSNTAFGLYIFNPLGLTGTPAQPQGVSLDYDLKFINNTFNRFKYAATFINTSAGIPNIYFEDNELTGSDNISHSGILGSKITGRFRNNNYVNNKFETAMFLSKGTPDLYNNSLKSTNATLALYANSVPRLSPVVSGSNYIWYGGRNTLYTAEGNMVISNYVNHPSINNGYNTFNKGSGTNHFIGQLRAEDGILEGKRNCWLTDGIPISDLYRIVNGNTIPVTIDYTPVVPSCIFDLNHVSTDTFNIGDGIYDTIFVTNTYSGSSIPVPDPELCEMLYGQAVEQAIAKDYYNSIVNFRTLIDTCMENAYIYSSLYELFSCYENLDTSSNPGISYGLWEEFNDYLYLKIEQYSEDFDFQDIAYDLALMCEVNMGNYEEAMLEYEGIILNHPDPVQRLLASWDYDAILYLLDSLDGEGGSMRMHSFGIGQLPNHQLRQSVGSGAFSAINFNDLEPVKRIIHEGYRERKIEDNKKAEEKMNTMLRDERNNSKLIAEEVRKDGIKREIESRARMNIMQLRHLSREEKTKKMMEDMNLIMQLTGGDRDENMINNTVPQNYDLRQNYPNPFNPKTIITFSIPSASLVKLNVYDITGRLMKVLTNEIREAGTHNVTFDGTGLSSGVYFYRLVIDSFGEAGNFVDTKRMVLVK